MPRNQMPVAIVTGASRGIGACISISLSRAGYRIALLARGGSRETAGCITDLGGETLDLRGDVRSVIDCESAVSDTLNTWGRMDLLINNAGVMLGDRDVVDTTPACWTEVLETNLNGAFFMVAAVLPAMITQGGGLIVNITSGAAVRSGFLNLPYGVSKAGLDRMTLGLGSELESHGIACLSLSPPVSATDTVRAMYPDRDVDAWAQPPELTAKALLALIREGPARYTGRVVSVREYLQERGELG